MSLLARFTFVCLVLMVAASMVIAQKSDDWTRMSDSKPKTIRHGEKIEVTYDKFKDTTFLRLVYMEVGEGVYLGAIASAKGPTYPLDSRVVLLTLSLHNDRWRCLQGCEVVFLVNGKRIDLGTAENLDRELGRTYAVVERIGVYVTPELFREIASGASVEFQAGTDEAMLKEKHLAALRDFASRIKP